MIRQPLTTRATVAADLTRHCRCCEHRCGADRLAGERGVCGAGSEARVWRYWVDHAEEPPLAPSLLIYLAGCDLRCAFCIAEANAFDVDRGQLLTPAWLDATVAWAVDQGARTLQWIGGEPTIHLAAVLRVLEYSLPRLPLVWKSNFWGTRESWQLLEGIIDTYVADFKFGNDRCAAVLAGVERYGEMVRRNLRRVAASQRLVVRHLLLPGHFDCCFRPIVDWLRRFLPEVPFSLLGGYLPCWRAHRHPELSQPLARGVYERAVELAVGAGLPVYTEGAMRHASP